MPLCKVLTELSYSPWLLVSITANKTITVDLDKGSTDRHKWTTINFRDATCGM